MKVEDRSGMKLVGVMGLARSGKTTVSDYLQEKYGFKRVSFADELKEKIIRALVKNPPPEFVWSFRFQKDLPTEEDWRRMIYHDRTPFTRWLMQFVGTDLFRDEEDEDYWIKEWLKVYYKTPGNIVVPDVRFPNEALCLKRMGGEIWRTIWVGQEASIEHGADHRSEIEAETIIADRVIQAPTGIENLHKAVDDIVRCDWGITGELS